MFPGMQEERLARVGAVRQVIAQPGDYGVGTTARFHRKPGAGRLSAQIPNPNPAMERGEAWEAPPPTASDLRPRVLVAKAGEEYSHSRTWPGGLSAQRWGFPSS